MKRLGINVRGIEPAGEGRHALEVYCIVMRLNVCPCDRTGSRVEPSKVNIINGTLLIVLVFLKGGCHGLHAQI